MKVDLNGKVALVTGSGDGIGKAIALTLARNGASIVVNDLETRGEETKEEISQLGQRALLVNADVRNKDEVKHLVSESEREFGCIDILVGNAGVNTPGELRLPINEFDETEWHRVIDVDLNGLFYCCREVTSGMVKRRQGVIVNIASSLGIVPMRNQSAFNAAKAGVINLTRSIALELGPYGIRANAIAPGSTLTRGTRELFYNPDNQDLAESLLSHVALGRVGEVEEVANAALFLASKAASYITGAVLAVDGGWTAGFARDW